MRYRIVNWYSTQTKPVPEAYQHEMFDEGNENQWFVDVDDLQKFIDLHSDFRGFMIRRDTNDEKLWMICLSKNGGFGQR